MYIWKEIGISFSLNVIIVYQQVSGKRTINGHDVTGPGQFRLVVSLDLANLSKSSSGILPIPAFFIWDLANHCLSSFGFLPIPACVKLGFGQSR
jgi:hypothetical protein